MPWWAWYLCGFATAAIPAIAVALWIKFNLGEIRFWPN